MGEKDKEKKKGGDLRISDEDLAEPPGQNIFWVYGGRTEQREEQNHPGDETNLRTPT